jgi:Sortilin, neurotensin receptor 3, C-terminal
MLPLATLDPLLLIDVVAGSDYNFVRHGSACVPVGPEPIPAGMCKNPDQMYMGSSGYRIIPGNTCDRNKGVKKDVQVEKKCSQGRSCLCLAFLGARRSGVIALSTTCRG